MRGVTLKLQNDALDKAFQLTRLMRGVTFCQRSQSRVQLNFNSHASCEA